MSESLSHEEAREIADQAANAAIRQTLSLLGVDVNDQKSINEFRADLVYARRVRLMSERAAAATMWGIAVTVAGGALLVFWDGIKAALRIKGIDSP